jgi:hypothetical protein
MPFDGTQTAPSLRMLSDILRDRSRWPAGFVWNFCSCRHCAMGLAMEIWNASPHYRDPIATTMALFDLDQARLFNLFTSQLSQRLGLCSSDITPEHVADAIDKHLASAA